MHSIKLFLAKYSAWIAAILQPLGPWGVLVVAALDGSFLGMPMDFIVGGYVYYHRGLFWLYILMASAGSALGSLVIYGIGYKGGEALLRKRMNPERFDRVQQKFDDHEFLALMLPAILPPPSPFKLFVLSAAAFEMNVRKFLLAIFLGRVIRFSILSALVLYFGPHIMSVMGELFKHHRWATLAVVAGIVLVLVLVGRRRNGRPRVTPSQGSQAPVA
ncbi:MAG TPA: VTT domain-containing protein [Terriglobales bacterium]|nr:VTT domain-containing protein [Terriglobales bacterium]